MSKTISVLGAGYVGLTTAALFSNAGYTVYIIDINQKRLDVIKQGKSFFYEYGLDPIISEGLRQKKLIPVDSYEDSIPSSDFIFSCVGTPDMPDGSSDLSYVFSAAKSALKYARDGTIYIQKSTVPVGTGQKIIELFSTENASLPYVSNPEFLREGSAINDTLWFDRVVIGSEDVSAVRKVQSLYKKLEQYRDEIAKRANLNPGTVLGEYITTSLSSAELIKVTSNAFLALKISFANSMAKLADATGADIKEVMDAVGADKRIGRSFLNAGRGYGGGCFPKDVSGLIASGLEHGVDLEIVKATQSVNESMPRYVVEKVSNSLQGVLVGKKITVLGLAFKSGTSDVRRSPGIAIANILARYGTFVTVYDPEALEEARDGLENSINLVPTFNEAVKNADAIVITTDWPEFTQLKNTPIESTVLIDAVNMLSGPGIIGIGTSSK